MGISIKIKRFFGAIFYYFASGGYMNRIRMSLCRYGCFLMSLLMLFTLMPFSVSAEKTPEKIVRVGYFEDAYSTVDDNGERSGYGYEYQQAVAAYTGWTYDYVASDWTDCFDRLQSGEIDILSAVSYTDERAEDMLFSDMPMGEEKYYLYADLENSDISAADLDTLDEKNVGVLENSIPEELMYEWEQKHDIDTTHINIISSDDVLEKLASHEIDCFVSIEEPQWAEKGITAVANIGNSGIYFVINKDREDLKDELDLAMRRIAAERPFYAEDLYKRYFSAVYTPVLYAEEKDWLDGHGKIHIGYLNDDYGVSYIDPDSGKLSGVISDYIGHASDCLGNASLEFETIGFDTRTEQLEALKNGTIDMIFHVSQNPYFAEQNGFIMSDTVWTFNLAALTVKDHFNEIEENSVAVSRENLALKAYISYNYPKWKIIEYDSLEAAEKAVRDGKADCFVVAANRVSKYNETYIYHSAFLTQQACTSFAVSKENTILLSILNKTLKTMPTAMLTGAVSMYSSLSDKVTVSDFIRAHFAAISIVGVSIFLIILLLILGLWRKTKQAADQSQKLNSELEEGRQQLQEALVQAQSANAAKTAFLNNMSHDIRTPINGILGMLNIIQKSEDDPQKVNDCLNKIDSSSKLLLSLVNDVLDMSKLESGSVILNNESVDLDRVCNEITADVLFQAEAAGLNVVGEHDDYSGVYIRSSSLHLKKVLMNLFTNCIKYNKPGGSIHTSMKTIERTDERITCKFCIEDTGIGMSEEFIENELFKPFAQADNSPRSSYMGTGLGMPIVKEIVEKMGGTITVESKLGEGSRFTVVLPFEIDRNAVPEKETENVTADISGKCLLVAEDNDLNLEIAEFVLTENGAKVVSAVNGEEAFKKFEASETGEFDAILMDVMMPVMDGLSATRAIRVLERPDAKTIPIIAMTANAFREDEEKCLEAGMNAHLAKPLDMEKVVSVISQLLRK